MKQLKINKSITNRESASMARYLADVGRERRLSLSEEVALARAIRRNDEHSEAALDALVRGNLRFVVSVAKQYQNQGISLPDLIIEGNVGLIKAARKFDETRGFKFISYAVCWIRQAIMQALAEQSRPVRLPLNQVGNLNKVKNTIAQFEQENERKPSVEEISEVLEAAGDKKMTESKVRESLQINKRVVSVDTPFAEGEDNTLLDVLINEDSPIADSKLINESLATEIERFLVTLSEREAAIVRRFYGIGGFPEMTLDEIGREFGLSRERVRQIKEKAIRRLKSNEHINDLKLYL